MVYIGKGLIILGKVGLFREKRYLGNFPYIYCDKKK